MYGAIVLSYLQWLFDLYFFRLSWCVNILSIFSFIILNFVTLIIFFLFKLTDKFVEVVERVDFELSISFNFLFLSKLFLLIFTDGFGTFLSSLLIWFILVLRLDLLSQSDTFGLLFAELFIAYSDACIELFLDIL